MLGAYGVSAQKQQVMLDKVVAVVGGSSILYSEVDDYARQIQSQRRAQGYTSDRDPQAEALENLMTQKLLYNQALVDSVMVNLSGIASSVEEQVAAMAEEAGGIAALEAREHMAIFNIRERLRQNYEEQSYAEAMQGDVIGKVKIIPGEVDRYYKRIDKDSLPIIPEQYVYAQITRLPKSIVQAKQHAKERLLEMRARIIGGEAKFDVLARMYSQDPGTMMRGGEMPPSALNELDPSFRTVLPELKDNQISEVFESSFGFHIVQMLERRGSLYRFRHIMLKPIYTDLEKIEAMTTLDSLVRLVRLDSLTFDKAALEYSADAHSKKNGGLVSNHEFLEYRNYGDPKLTQTAFLKEDFGNYGKVDDYDALKRLKVGEISAAFLTQDMGGNDLIKVVKLVEIIPTHKASINEDYLRMEELALRAKQDRVFNEWISKKIDAMYVFITPAFRSTEFRNKHWLK